MSMISEQIKLLEMFRDSLVDSGAIDRDNVLIDDAIGTIQILSARLAVANMEQSSAYYNGGWVPANQPPESGEYVLLSFSNFSLPYIGRYSDGAFYLGDCDGMDTCVANDLYVNAWMPLPRPYYDDITKKE